MILLEWAVAESFRFLCLGALLSACAKDKLVNTNPGDDDGMFFINFFLMAILKPQISQT